MPLPLLLALALLVTSALVATYLLRPLQRRTTHQTTTTNTEPNTTPNAHQYAPHPRLCTTAELHLYKALRVAFPNHAIMSQIRLAQVITPRATKDRSQYQRALNHIAAKSLDFAICDPDTLAVLALVELDDASHATTRQRDRDATKDTAIQSAGLTLQRIPTAPSYDPQQLQSLITLT